MAAPRIHADETVQFQAHPGSWQLAFAYLVTLGLYAIVQRTTTYTVTDQRVILTRGVITRTSQSVPLHMVQDASDETTLGVGRVVLSSAGGALSVQRFGPMRAADARAMADEIMKQVAAHARGVRGN